jgi:hypothetical protein
MLLLAVVDSPFEDHSILRGVSFGELLALERMHLLNMAHHWSTGTHTTYQGKLCVVRKFKDRYAVPILKATPLLQPPHGVDIPLMWC